MGVLSELTVGVVGVLVGVIIGNRLALRRDKRREYNAIAEPLFERLENQILVAKKGQFPPDCNSLEVSSFVILREKIPKRKRENFDRALNRYQKAKNECGGYFGPGGSYEFNRPEILVDSTRELQKFVRPR